MEVEEKTIGPVEFEGNPLLWTISKTGVPRMLVTGFLSFARYCGDQLPKRTTMGCLRILAALLVIVVPRSITYLLLYPIFRLVFGNLYPAYASYKAVRTKNVKEYVKWMMYWIVFALFTCAETFTDVFFSFWFPFYYEIKTILVVWLLSPATKGSSILYRRFVHPALIRREAEIDEALARATEQGYTAVLHLGSKGVNYATTVLMQTAIKGGGGLVQQLKKSYSLSDLTGEKEDENRNTPHAHDETDMQVEPRRREQPGRRGYSPRRTQSSSTRVDMYFSEVDVDVRQARSSEPTASLTNIRSSDDISSGYSSGEALQSSRTSHGDSSFVRTASVGARTRVKPRSTTKKTPEDLGEDSDTIESPCPENISIPSSLSLVTPQQALQILLLLSRNSNIADFIEFERNSFPLNDNVDSLKNSTSQLGPEATITDLQESDSNHTPNSDLITDVQVIHSVEVKPLTTLSSLEIERSKGNESVEKFQTEETGTKETDDKAASSTDSSSSDTLISEPIRTVTDEICQNKFDELRQLLNDAHRAMSGIVHTQDQLKHSNDETVSKKDSPGDSTRECYKGSNVSEENENENESTSFVDVWATPSGSRRNSDSLCRAGRYNKKPAPKAPPAKSVEDLVNDQAPAALKATLVIKTGTVRTFANTETTKDVFISHASDATVKKGKKFNKQKTKESFSKLLTIPKNILQSAFHRDGKNSSTDAASSGSRSNSVEPQDLIGVDFEKKSQLDSGGQINVLKDGDVVDKNDDNDTSNSSSDDHVAASSDNVEHLDKVEKIVKGKDELVLGNAELPMRRLESDIF